MWLLLLCSQLCSNTWPPYAFFITPWPAASLNKTLKIMKKITCVAWLQILAVLTSIFTISAVQFWHYKMNSRMHVFFLSCCCIFCNPQLFVTFVAFSKFSQAFHLHCPWLIQWLSITWKGNICRAADNTLYPQAPAGFSRAATQSLDWQVWPLLCLVRSCLWDSCFFANVSRVFSLVPLVAVSTVRCALELPCHLAVFVCSLGAWKD